MRSDSISELAVALVAAQGEFTAVPKDSDNPFFNSKYASLPKVVAAASPILSKHGLAVSQFPGINEAGHDTLTTWLLHTSGQFIAEPMLLHLGKNDTAQAQGSATTYARRYAYMAALGLVADEDDDGNTASRPRTAAAPAVATAPALLTSVQRVKVIDALTAAGHELPLVLASLGIADIGELTVEHAARIRKLIDEKAEEATA